VIEINNNDWFAASETSHGFTPVSNFIGTSRQFPMSNSKVS